MIFICYPKCSTCKKAQKFLDDHKLEYTYRHIVEENPKEAEILDWMEKFSGTPRQFFNTSGILYREQHLKDKVANMSKEEMAKLLATNGMLVKRPQLILKDKVLVGFNEERWRQALGI